jgi:hypothetical protein
MSKRYVMLPMGYFTRLFLPITHYSSLISALQ